MGGAVSWISVKQKCVALSTAEAEYMALAGAVQEAVWMRQLLMYLVYQGSNAMTVYEDNQSSICMTKNPQFHTSRYKHIDIKYYFVCEKVIKYKIALKYCKTGDMMQFSKLQS